MFVKCNFCDCIITMYKIMIKMESFMVVQSFTLQNFIYWLKRKAGHAKGGFKQLLCRVSDCIHWHFWFSGAVPTSLTLTSPNDSSWNTFISLQWPTQNQKKKILWTTLRDMKDLNLDKIKIDHEWTIVTGRIVSFFFCLSPNIRGLPHWSYWTASLGMHCWLVNEDYE